MAVKAAAARSPVESRRSSSRLVGFGETAASEPKEFVSYTSHGGNHGHHPAPLALGLNNSLGDVTDPFRCANRGATIFLDYQAHVQIDFKPHLITVIPSGVENGAARGGRDMDGQAVD